jgi:hypothetical protein
MSLLTYPYANPQKEDWTLIQRNLTNQKMVGRGYLAFDKCTLLSSQGSDAPGIGDLTGRFITGATSLS